MSFAASVGRDMMLTARNSDLVFQINLLTENMMQVGNAATRLSQTAATAPQGSPQAAQIKSQQDALSQVNKGLEMKVELLRAQQRAVQTEIDSVRKAISENIQSSFKTFANS